MRRPDLQVHKLHDDQSAYLLSLRCFVDRWEPLRDWRRVFCDAGGGASAAAVRRCGVQLDRVCGFHNGTEGCGGVIVEIKGLEDILSFFSDLPTCPNLG